MYKMNINSPPKKEKFLKVKREIFERVSVRLLLQNRW